MIMQKGQRVLVWSLQSFYHGGFLNGAPAFIRQSDTGSSVFVCVERNKHGVIVIDDAYEVYPQQVRVVEKEYWPASKALKKYRKKIMRNPSIS